MHPASQTAKTALISSLFLKYELKKTLYIINIKKVQKDT
jgi:chemotaxis signal transduction protein